MKLNIGAGGSELPGFTPVDIKLGRKAYPLDVPPGSVEEIYASHILEHFGHNEVPYVIADWVRALQPGGRIRIAVPDFAKVSETLLAGRGDMPIEAVVMGGQIDADDFHRSIFVVGKLRGLMEQAGLENIGPWTSEIRDCASLPVSLNLQGFKPAAGAAPRPRTSESPIVADPKPGAVIPAPLGRIVAVWSCPRLGFMDAFDSIFRSLGAANIKLLRGMGVFWGQQIESLMDSAIAEDRADLILCFDYDAVFTPADLSEVLRLAAMHPEAAAICAHQWNRAADRPLWNAEGNRRVEAAELESAGDLFPIATGHFGLTILRTSVLAKMPKPWFHATPAPDGTWGQGKIDSDITFWHKLRAAGGKAYLAPRVVIGHLELAVRWPGSDLHLRWQHMYDYHKDGKPVDAFGTSRAS